MKTPILKIIILILILNISIIFFASSQNEEIKFDLEILRGQQFGIFATAYDNVFLQPAWEEIQKAIDQDGLDMSITTIGIVESDGVDVGHREFRGTEIDGEIVGRVNFGDTPLLARVDRDEKSHGTAVAAIIGANNLSFFTELATSSPQMTGVLGGASPDFEYVLEFRKSGTSLLIFNKLKSIFEAQSSGVDIINLSLGSVKRSELTEEQKELVGGQLGPLRFLILENIWKNFFDKYPNTLFVAAAGNEDLDAEHSTPANLSNLPNVVTVGAVNLLDKRDMFSEISNSNFGSSVNISAPGTQVYSAARHDEYNDLYSGTSFSAPFVTGVAGLLKAINPDLTPAELKQILVETSDPIQAGETDKRLGTGCYSDPNDQTNTGCRLNAHTAVCHEEALNCEEASQQQSIFYDFEDGTAGASLQTSPLWEKSGGAGAPNIVFTSNNPLTGNLAGFVDHTGTIAPSNTYLYQGPVSILDDHLYKATLWFRHDNELSMQPVNSASNMMFAGFKIDNWSCGVTFSTQNSDDLHVHAGLTTGTATRWSPQNNTFLGYLPNEWTPVRVVANIETGDCTTSFMPEESNHTDHTEENHLPQDPSSASFIIFSSVNAVIYDPWHIYMDDFGNSDSSLNSHLGEE